MRTKYCPKCGTLNRENARFCAKCGTPLEMSANKEAPSTVSSHKNHKWLWIILSTVAVLVIIAGLLAWIIHSKSTGPKSETSTIAQNADTKPINYDQLSSSDQKNVHFKFTLSQDNTKDNTADPVYVVSMEVTNQTNKTIKFYKNKFVYLLPVGKILSSKTGTLTVKAGHKATVDQLFEDVPEQGTVGSGIIEYLNSSHKLAYANFVNNIASSDNLTDGSLISQNRNTTGVEDTNDNSKDTDTDNGDDNYESSSTDQSSADTQSHASPSATPTPPLESRSSSFAITTPSRQSSSAVTRSSSAQSNATTPSQTNN